ncbi:MAG: gamma-glutamyl-gamma-aminobutyrate hydrolase family protein [Propionibacteriales bacterium]|nr:gamma-glutamyl-gamma-aminobutyrate hydrolase family protein [Propionibacteriales bacterium]
MTRPIIGVTSYCDPATWGRWTRVPAVLVPERYIGHVRAAGGLPVVVPPLGDGATPDDAEAMLARLDGLVLIGGADVESRHYGQEPHLLAQESRVDRDASELLLATTARDRIPVLGVCRGMQIMAVAAGGVLEQHLPDRIGHLEHAPGPATYGRRVVEPRRGSRLASLLGDRLEVNCHHHQGVASHPSYEVAAWSSDGVIEAIESPDSAFHIGVQWHPETGADGRLFDALVSAAADQLAVEPAPPPRVER